MITCVCQHVGRPFKRWGPARRAEESWARLGEGSSMADSGALPAGFGELEVLAVGTVLLVEGEPGKRWVEWGPGAPGCRPQLWR